MWNQYCAPKVKIPLFKVVPLCIYLHSPSIKTASLVILDRHTAVHAWMFVQLKLCWNGLLVFDQGEKSGLSLHITSCSNTLKNLKANTLSKASMLSYFKLQWNIMTQNRRWPEKFRIFLSPSKLKHRISRTWYNSLKEQKSENLKALPPP